MISRIVLSVSALLVATLVLTGCSAAKRDALPLPKGSVPMVIDPGSDSYEDTSEEMAEIKKEPKPTPSQAEKEPTNLSLEKDLCTRVGDNVIEFSKVAAGDSSSAYISRILDFDLITDNRETVSIPVEEEVAVVIECRVQVELSTGDVGSVSIYELIDNAGETRVRWDSYVPE